MKTSRREFVKQTAAAALSAIAGLSLGRSVHAAGSDELKIGLVGCGGRGNGAALNALNADPGNKLVALADVFPDPIPGTIERLKDAKPEQVDVKQDRCFVGFDAYQGLLATDVDAVLLALPSHFHCIHLKAAIEAGKHVFCEKPHAVDASGVKMVAEACQLAKQKNLAVLSGLCFRYNSCARETVGHVHDGAIGQIRAVHETYLRSGWGWNRPRQPEDTEMAYQVHNWQNFHWLSGDLSGLTLIHSLDMGSWALGDLAPKKAWGLGGRQIPPGDIGGDLFDHQAIVYEYPDGVLMHAYASSINGGYGNNASVIIGEKGYADLCAGRISGENKWRYRGQDDNMYDVEHQEWFASIRAGNPINNGDYMVTSTMLSVLGRMAAYTGQILSWQEALESTFHLAPDRYDFAATPPTAPDEDGNYPIAMPGITKVA